MTLYKILEEELKKENNFIDDNGELKKILVLNKAQNFDGHLIEILLNNQELKNAFFIKIKDSLVFNQNKFIQFLEQKNYLNDSYTQYKNKLGLKIGNKFLKQNNEVALVWPFKDCVLEGGQSSEEKKKNEIFFNELLAQDEITQLFEEKVLTNAKCFNKSGSTILPPPPHYSPLKNHSASQIFNRDENGTITDNLIIKGNNLLALHSIKKEFTGKIKLIYIDPPYNTGKDGFKYNDNFNHSTWLTFMKNRLEIAKDLLRDDGVVFVQCDDNEQAYLKVLMDEIFGRDNFVASAPRKTGAGAAAKNADYELRKPYDFIVIFSKNKLKTEFNKLLIGKKEYKLEDDFGKYTLCDFQASGSDATRTARPNLYYPIYVNENNTLSLEKTEQTIKKILPEKYKGEDGRWMWKKEKIIKDSAKFLLFDGKKIKRKKYFDETEDQNKYQVEKAYFEDSNFRNAVGTIELKSIFNNQNVFNNPKPEYLIKKIVEISTKANDIVLDFCLGSGTTAAVAHKMGRQYIGIEQMDYIEDIAVERLKKVIAGEQGGISKSVDWKGGGEFIYLELKKYNQNFIDAIEKAKSSDELLEIWETMKAKSFLNYNLDIKKQDENISELKKLRLAEQKQHLCEILDKNQLYVNLSSLEDKDFLCTDVEKQITKDFYGMEE